MLQYLYAFALSLASIWWHKAPVPGGHADRELKAIVADIASTDCSELECLTLVQVSGMESGWERSAVGKAGERTAFQLLGGTWDPQHPAREALRRLRVQGWRGFMGFTRCDERCEQMRSNRRLLAAMWLEAFPRELDSSVVALRTP